MDVAVASPSVLCLDRLAAASGKQRIRMDWRLRPPLPAVKDISSAACAAEEFFMSMVAPAAFRDLSNDDEVRREVHSSFSDGHLSRSHVALLCGKLRAGVLAAVVRPMLCMAECGLPCSAIERPYPYPAAIAGSRKSVV